MTPVTLRPMAWFRKEKKPKEAVEKQTAIPEGLWIKCPGLKGSDG